MAGLLNSMLYEVVFNNWMSQAWPLPPAYGTTLGYMLGALGAVIVSAVH
jgi:hypothetical protein